MTRKFAQGATRSRARLPVSARRLGYNQWELAHHKATIVEFTEECDETAGRCGGAASVRRARRRRTASLAGKIVSDWGTDQAPVRRSVPPDPRPAVRWRTRPARSASSASEMARSKPDGYTLFVGNVSTNAITPVLFKKKFSVNFEKDVVSVSRWRYTRPFW